jgi:hypothetical protein
LDHVFVLALYVKVFSILTEGVGAMKRREYRDRRTESRKA